MSANRGPKPSLAPKPRAPLEPNGTRGRCVRSRQLASSGEVEEEPQVVAEERNPSIQGPLCSTEDANVETEAEDEVTQKMDGDWRVTDSALTEEADSLEAASEDAVDMADADLTEEMDAEGWDGGEALADTDGISMGDVSVHETGGGPPTGSLQGKTRQEELRVEEEDAADDWSESLTEDPSVLPKDGQERLFLTHKADDHSVSGCSCHEPTSSPETGRRRNLQEVRFYDFSSLKLQKSRNTKEAEDSCENYVEIFKNSGRGPHQPWEDASPEGTPELLLGRLEQPRVRLVSVSLTSESSLLSPNDSELSDLEGHVGPFLDDTTDTEQDFGEDRVYERAGHASEGEGGFPLEGRSAASRSWSLSRRLHTDVAELQRGQGRLLSGLEHPPMNSSPIPASRQKNQAKPLYLSRYPRSISMEGQKTSTGVYSYMEGSPRRGGGAAGFSGGFWRCSPSSSALSTPTSVVDIPPPFELAYITKRPITKSSPSLFVEEDASEKTRKKKSSIKHFLMLKFRRKTDGKSAADVSPSSSESLQQASGRLLDPDRPALTGSPRLTSRCAPPRPPQAPPPTFLLHEPSRGKGSGAAFLDRSIVRVESFEERSRAPFVPLPLTKPRSISFPNTDTSDYENVPPVSSDYENVRVPQRRQVPLPEAFGRPARALASASETDGYVDMSSLPGFKGKTQPLVKEAERYGTTQEPESPLTHNYHTECKCALSRQ